jgi:HAD superfamily hydrolase (TIGR01509 family)
MVRAAGTELIVFDCDGVLVDSEIISNTVLAEFLTELGWALGLDEALERFKGLAMGDIWARVTEETGQTITGDMDRAFRKRQLAALAYVKAVPGVRELVATLTLPYCAASNGPPEKMTTTLGAAGLLEWFEGRLFSTTHVDRPKPHPDLFLYAADRMGHPPESGLVIEDSPLGIEAALRAGMRALGFAGTRTSNPEALHEAGAEAVLSDIRELSRYLPIS